MSFDAFIQKLLIILLPRCSQECVINAINNLVETVTLRLFRKYFEVILTDNGAEFKNPWDIEKNESGTQRTKVFYCDPYVSNQKGRLEKNHEYIRYIKPKGSSFADLNKDKVHCMMDHINSEKRDSLNGHSPYELSLLLLDNKIHKAMGLELIVPDEVMLCPALLK